MQVHVGPALEHCKPSSASRHCPRPTAKMAEQPAVASGWLTEDEKWFFGAQQQQLAPCTATAACAPRPGYAQPICGHVPAGTARVCGYCRFCQHPRRVLLILLLHGLFSPPTPTPADCQAYGRQRMQTSRAISCCEAPSGRSWSSGWRRS